MMRDRRSTIKPRIEVAQEFKTLSFMGGKGKNSLIVVISVSREQFLCRCVAQPLRDCEDLLHYLDKLSNIDTM